MEDSMAAINKVILIGNLGRDPEMRYFQDGKAVANFSIATTDKWKDKATGESREKTEWHRIVAFGRLGEICGEYLSKGKQVYIEGRLRTRSWEKDGITKYTTEIEATQMQMLGSRDSSSDFSGNRANEGAQGGYNKGGGNDFQGGPPPVEPPEDDIPF